MVPFAFIRSLCILMLCMHEHALHVLTSCSVHAIHGRGHSLIWSPTKESWGKDELRSELLLLRGGTRRGDGRRVFLLLVILTIMSMAMGSGCRAGRGVGARGV